MYIYLLCTYMRTRGHTCMQGLHVRSRRTCPSLYMHNDYMPIRGVQGRIHIYNTSGGRKRGKIVGGRAPLLVLMSNRPEELVQHVWSIWLISLCGQPDANLRSISDRTRNCVSGRKSYDCEKLLLPKCIRRQPIEPWIHSWWGIDPHVRLLVSPRLSSRIASRRITVASRNSTAALGIAPPSPSPMYCSGSNSSSQEMNPTLQKRLLLHAADCYAILVIDENAG